MPDNAQTIEELYAAFRRRDHAAMAACYHASVHFSDPAFGDLHGNEVRAMWHMLCERGADLEVTFGGVEAHGDQGSAHWEARYTFSPTGRTVHNRIRAAFTFESGRIIRHADVFDMWRWTRMALGAPGILTGWTWFTKNKVRQTARRSLHRFIDEHPEYTR
jgi:ketosteroid isomerase-like protein